jgi:broad specificity phosphatase PhoE
LRLYLIRHGSPDYAVDGLTKEGHLEAQALAKRLTRLGLDRLYSSPLGRARATAKYTEEALGKTAEVLPWTRELSDWKTDQPPWGRLMAWDTPGEIMRSWLPVPGDALEVFPPFQGLSIPEGFVRLAGESDRFLESLGFRREGHRYKAAIFCHGGFGLTWLAHLLQIPLTLAWSGFWLAPTSVTTILMDERTSEWATPRCVGLCDVSHLYAEGLPVSSHGINANKD